MNWKTSGNKIVGVRYTYNTSILVVCFYRSFYLLSVNLTLDTAVCFTYDSIYCKFPILLILKDANIHAFLAMGLMNRLPIMGSLGISSIFDSLPSKRFVVEIDVTTRIPYSVRLSCVFFKKLIIRSLCVKLSFKVI